MTRLRSGGFTLVETMIALALTLAVSGLVLDLLRGQQRLARIAGADVEVQLTLHSAPPSWSASFGRWGREAGGLTYSRWARI